jgi:hypothetical protein
MPYFLAAEASGNGAALTVAARPFSNPDHRG